MYAGGQFSANAFFIAMDQLQRGEKGSSSRVVRSGPRLDGKARRPRMKNLLRFRAEAATLLGLPEKLTPEQELAKADDVKFTRSS